MFQISDNITPPEQGVHLNLLEEVFNRCSEEIRVFKEAFAIQYCADEGDLTGYLNDDYELSTETIVVCYFATKCLL